MNYSVNYQPEAIDDLDRLAQVTRAKILKKIEWLKGDFEQIPPLPLIRSLSGFYKLRVEDYWVIYQFNKEHKKIYILRMGHRREIYED